MLGVALAVATAAWGARSTAAPATQSITAAQSAQGAPTAADPNNPLIGGNWKLVSETDNKNLPGVTCTVTDMTYTATQMTQTAAGVPSTTHVTYLASPTKVYVVTSAGLMNAADFLVLDKDTIRLDAILACTYHRVT
jgi:hypothetical protein